MYSLDGMIEYISTGRRAMSWATPTSRLSEYMYSGRRMRPARTSQASSGRQARNAQAGRSCHWWSDFSDGEAFSCTVADQRGLMRQSACSAARLSALKVPLLSIQRR